MNKTHNRVEPSKFYSCIQNKEPFSLNKVSQLIFQNAGFVAPIYIFGNVILEISMVVNVQELKGPPVLVAYPESLPKE